MNYKRYQSGYALLFFLFFSFTARAQELDWRHLKQFGLLAGGSITVANPAAVEGSAGAGNAISPGVHADWAFAEKGQLNFPAAYERLQQNRSRCLDAQATPISSALGGQTLQAGVYATQSPAALGRGETLTLRGEATELFIFNITGKLLVEAQSQLVLDGVSPANVIWNVSGDYEQEANAEFSGVVMAQSIYLDGDYTGKLTLLAEQDITLANGSGRSAYYSRQPAVLNWQDAGGFGLLAGNGIAADNPVHITGSAGAAQSIAGSFTVTGSRFPNGQGNVAAALSQVQDNTDLLNGLDHRPGEAVLSEAGLDSEQDIAFNGHHLTAGAYFFKQDLTLQGAITLTGDPASVFIFNVAGSLTVEQGAAVILDGVRPENVYWNVAQNLDIAKNAVTAGIFMVAGSAQATGPLYGHSALLALGSISLSIYAAGTGQDRFFSRKALKDKPGGSLPAAVCPLPGAPTNGSRNFIMNGSFEERDTCGTNANLVPVLPAGAFPDPTPVCHWYTPNEAHGLAGSPDYYNECNPALPLNYSEPGNVLGWQAAYSLTGAGSRKGYAGINCYVDSVRSNGQPGDYREYLHQQLPASRTLKANRHYYGEFYTVLAENSGMAVARLGMLFSAAAPVTAYSKIIAPAGRQPQVVNTPNFDFLDDTASWTKIAGTFKAGGGEQYVTIGNFWPRTDANGDSTAAPSGVPLTGIQPLFRRNAAYYFIDGVALYEIPYAGEPVTVCAGGSVTLGSVLGLPASLNPTYQWSAPGYSATTQQVTVSPTQTTTYTLTVTIPASPGFAQSVTASSVTVTVPAVTAGPDFSLCANAVLQSLTGQPAGGSWSGTGVTQIHGFYYFDPGQAGSQAAAYPLVYTYTGSCGGSSDTALVTLQPVPQVSVQTVSATPCDGGSAAALVTGAQNGTYTVAVSGSSSSSSSFTVTNNQGSSFSIPLPVTAPGSYTVTVTAVQTGCSATVAFTIAAPQVIGAPGKTTVIDASDYPDSTFTFSGPYHVKGNLFLQHGTFHVTDNSVFYFDNDGTPHSYGGFSVTTGALRVSNATLNVTGSTFTISPCALYPEWWGIHLTDGAKLNTYPGAMVTGNSFTNRYSEISYARNGITSLQETGPNHPLYDGTAFPNYNYYSITYMTFRHNITNFVDRGKGWASVAGEGIRNCIFYGGMGFGAVPNNPLSGGDYSLAQFTGNTFHNGFVSGTANNLTLEDNDFFWQPFPTSPGGFTPVIALSPHPGNAAAFVHITGNRLRLVNGLVGIEAHRRTTVTGNLISAGTATAATKGISAYGPGVELRENLLLRLGVGIEANGSGMTAEENRLESNLTGIAFKAAAVRSANAIRKNTFTDNGTGILFESYAANTGNTPPEISCNTFEAPNRANTKGIHLDQFARLTAAGNPNILGGDGDNNNPNPNGNLFINITQPVYNHPVNDPLRYYVYYPSTVELKINGITNGIIDTSTAFTGLRACDNGPTGVNTRQSQAGAAPEKNLEEDRYLGDAFPNPAQGQATVGYKLPSGTITAVIILREVMTGRMVKTWELKAGTGQLEMDLQPFKSGLYAYTLVADGKPQETKLLLITK